MTATGTAFNVRKARNSVLVSVQEGTVRVTPVPSSDRSATAADRHSASLVLTEREQLSYDALGFTVAIFGIATTSLPSAKVDSSGYSLTLKRSVR